MAGRLTRLAAQPGRSPRFLPESAAEAPCSKVQADGPPLWMETHTPAALTPS